MFRQIQAFGSKTNLRALEMAELHPRFGSGLRSSNKLIVKIRVTASSKTEFDRFKTCRVNSDFTLQGNSSVVYFLTQSGNLQYGERPKHQTVIFETGITNLLLVVGGRLCGVSAMAASQRQS